MEKTNNSKKNSKKMNIDDDMGWESASNHSAVDVQQIGIENLLDNNEEVFYRKLLDLEEETPTPAQSKSNVIMSQMEKENTKKDESAMNEILNALKVETGPECKKKLACYVPKHSRPRLENLKMRITYANNLRKDIKIDHWGYCPWGNCIISNRLLRHFDTCPFRINLMSLRIGELEENNEQLKSQLKAYQGLRHTVTEVYSGSNVETAKEIVEVSKRIDKLDNSIKEIVYKENPFCAQFYKLNDVINNFGLTYNNCLTRCLAYLDWLPYDRLRELEVPLKQLKNGYEQELIVDYEISRGGERLIADDWVQGNHETLDAYILTIASGIVLLETGEWGHAIPIQSGQIIPVSNWPDVKWRYLPCYKKQIFYRQLRKEPGNTNVPLPIPDLAQFRKDKIAAQKLAAWNAINGPVKKVKKTVVKKK